jgi:hypothetical protein
MKHYFAHTRFVFFTGILSLFFVARVALVQGACDPNIEFCNPLGDVDLMGLIMKFLDFIVILAFPFLMLYIIYAGFLYVRAQGNTQKIGEANRALMGALIGSAIILGIKGIGLAIQATLTEFTSKL